VVEKILLFMKCHAMQRNAMQCKVTIYVT